MERVTEKFNVIGEPLGKGAEKTVYQLKDYPDQVVGLYHEDSENKEITHRQMKATYYLTKIVHILFPKNIPDVHFASSEPKAIGRKKVELGEEHEILKKSLDPNQPRTDEFKEQVRKAGKKLSYGESKRVTRFVRNLYDVGVLPERSAYNFGYDEERNVIFVEPFTAFYFQRSKKRWVLGFSTEKLKIAIAKLEDEDKRKNAMQYFERIMQLFAEEKEQQVYNN